MAVTDLWIGRDKQPTSRHGRGLRWRVTVPGHPTRAFHTKNEAQAHEAQLRTAPTTRGSDVLVDDLVAAWLAGKAGLSPRGVVACQGDARHVLDRWAGALASAVETHEVQAWIARMVVEKGPKADRRIVPASEALRRRVFQCLQGALDIAVQTGRLGRNPCAGVRVPRDHRREGVFLTVAQVADLAEHAGRYGPLVWLLATSGLRVGEACALLVSDVDASRGRVRVRQAKGGRGRDVPVPAKVLAMLDLARPGKEWLFTNRDGRRVDVDHFRARAWRRALEAAGLSGVRVHDLRHTAASLAIASGADVKAVQRMLGHASATLTLDTYGHLLDGGLDDVATRMDSMLGG